MWPISWSMFFTPQEFRCSPPKHPSCFSALPVATGLCIFGGCKEVAGSRHLAILSPKVSLCLVTGPTPLNKWISYLYTIQLYSIYIYTCDYIMSKHNLHVSIYIYILIRIYIISRKSHHPPENAWFWAGLSLSWNITSRFGFRPPPQRLTWPARHGRHWSRCCPSGFSALLIKRMSCSWTVYLVGGFNPSEKYGSVGIIPKIWKNITFSKPPTSCCLFGNWIQKIWKWRSCWSLMWCWWRVISIDVNLFSWYALIISYNNYTHYTPHLVGGLNPSERY